MESVNDFLRLDFFLQECFSDTQDVLWYYEPQSNILIFSPRVEGLLGYRAQDLSTPERFLEKVYGLDRFKVKERFKEIWEKNIVGETDFRLIMQDDNLKWIKLRAKKAEIEGRFIMAGSLSDFDELKKTEILLRERSFVDSLTGLPNRLLLPYKLNTFIAEAENKGSLVGLLLIDIDDFKLVNESCGHSGGNYLLQEFAKVFRGLVNSDRTAYRVSGDGFVLLFRNLHNREEIFNFWSELRKKLNREWLVEGSYLSITVSSGATLYPEDGSCTDDLLNNVNIALKKAKSQGKGEFSFFRQEYREYLVNKKEMELKMAKALQNREFFLLCQPQLNLENERIAGLEFLIRWQDSESGRLIPPVEFIPFAEESGFIVPLGKWVLEEACSIMSFWRRKGLKLVPGAVNVSSQQIKNGGFYELILEVVGRADIPFDLLEFEITESMFLESSEMIKNLFEKIRALGSKIALDDFGTGYSSLNYIKDFPLDIIKIDRAFINDMQGSSREKAIASTIVLLAHILNLDVVAEGIETKEQYEYLKKIGCNLVQGYYVSKPILPEEMEKLLSQKEN